MELEFDIKISSGVLYDYMMHHTYTSLSGILGTIVGILLLVSYFMYGGVLFLIFGMIVICYLPWNLFLKSKQQMLSNPAFKEPLHYKMDEEGIWVSQGEETQMQKWEDMVKAISTPKSIIVYTSRVNASLYPRKELGELTPKVIEMISTHMPPNKVKIRG